MQMNQDGGENGGGSGGNDLNGYRRLFGGNMTSLDAYSTSAMSNFNHDLALKSA
jgi:hypothetical protein